MNCFPTKFDQVKVILKNVDVLVIKLEGFTMTGIDRLDRNCNGGCVIIYVREDIPSKILEKHKLPQHIEGQFIELKVGLSAFLKNVNLA